MEGFEHYEYTVDENFDQFEFDSDGPKGKFQKIVKLRYVTRNMYLISFGDLDPITRRLNDKAISNNSDTAKVVFTLAKIILDFTELFPEARLFFTGSTKSRTRLYQMMINKYRDMIQTIFTIDAYYNGEEETFILGRNYNSFVVSRKKMNYYFNFDK